MTPVLLSNKVVLVTGSGQGLGEQIARTLHAAGAKVVVNYFADPAGTNRARAEKVVAELGDRAVALEADVRNLAQVEAMVAKIGRLDIVINNAGIVRDKTLKNMPPEWWQQVIDTNLTGVFNVCKAAVPVLAEGGRIVNVSSLSAFVGLFGQANYAAAKAGVLGLTKVLSRELAKRQITVNAVAPGVVLTEMGQTIPAEMRAEMLKQIPLGRLGEPQDVANVVLFLCSDWASYITGQTMHVNGGWFM